MRNAILRNSSFSRFISTKIIPPQSLNKNVKAAIYGPPIGSGQYFRSIVVDKDAKLKPVLIRSQIVTSQPESIISALDSLREDSGSDVVMMDPIHIEKIFSSFEEGTRQQFLDHLNQSAVDHLGIRSSSSRIDLYNQCMPDRNFDDTDLEGLKTWERAVRNRSRTIASFPLILQAIERADIYDKRRLLDNIDHRPSSKPTEFFKDVFQIPHATSGFVRRIANAPDLESAKTLHDFLSDGLSKRGEFDENEFNRRVANIPLPHNQEEYAAMWKVLKALNRCRITNHAKAQIFLNIGQDWIKNATVIKDDFEDLVQKYSRTLADDLVLPAYIREFKDKDKPALWRSPKRRFEKFDDWFTDHARAQCFSVIDDAVLSKLTPEKLLKYADRLEHMTGEINQAKPVLNKQLELSRESEETRLPEWHRIFPDQEINGIKFKVILNSSELQQEGDEMRHCVVSLRKNCLFGDAHILSGFHPSTGERFSVHLKSSGRGAVRFIEATGVRNAFISNEVREAVDILLAKLSKGEIKISDQVGNVKKDFTVTDALGFDVQTYAEGVFRAYREAGVLPMGIEKSMGDRESFYQTIGLPSFFAANIEKDLQRSTREDVPSTILRERANTSKIKEEKLICLD